MAYGSVNVLLQLDRLRDCSVHLKKLKTIHDRQVVGGLNADWGQFWRRLLLAMKSGNTRWINWVTKRQ